MFLHASAMKRIPILRAIMLAEMAIAQNKSSFYEIPLKDIDGQGTSLKAYQGKWNFGKFLLGRDGRILKRFEPQTKSDAPELIEAVEAAVAAK